ncbi:hypothetical protein CEUSTIGMA_g7453.t1 [Chlamydomonas eustigma]|uniref:RAP domain-containing protein n=1 Tax=Chlamydomonas eustigma TaxID=1157962 RepID=A0A250XAC4_9CHLO|nr:hypothetical protein CEUSTIGMA_g7453.t1 [Chlamydomonas eustigma]|eukprot:GAX80014.1 hypothetical protein CEUSTIGMA_g7453.t1 [Chlamydomonas eustigma]
MSLRCPRSFRSIQSTSPLGSGIVRRSTCHWLIAAWDDNRSPGPQSDAPLETNTTAKSNAVKRTKLSMHQVKHGGHRRKQAEKKRRCDTINGSICQASTLSELNIVVKRHQGSLDSKHISAALSKLITFTEAGLNTNSSSYYGASASASITSSLTNLQSLNQQQSTVSTTYPPAGYPLDTYHDGTTWEEVGSGQDSDFSDDDDDDPSVGDLINNEAVEERLLRASTIKVSTSRATCRDNMSNYARSRSHVHPKQVEGPLPVSHHKVKALTQKLAVLALPKPCGCLITTVAIWVSLRTLNYKFSSSDLNMLFTSTAPKMKAACTTADVDECDEHAQNPVVHRASEKAGAQARAVLHLLQSLQVMKVQLPSEWSYLASSTLCRHVDVLTPGQMCEAAFVMGLLTSSMKNQWQERFCSVSSAAILLAPGEVTAGSEASPGLTVLPAQALSYLEGCTAMGLDLDEGWRGRFCAATLNSLTSYTESELTAVMKSLVVLDCKPDEAWLESFYASTLSLLRSRSQQQLQRQQRSLSVGGCIADNDDDRRSVEQLTEVVSALAHLGCRPDSSWLNECLMRTRKGLPAASVEQLACLIQSLAALRFRAPEAWLQPYMAAAISRIPFAKPQQCSVMLSAVRSLGCVPQGLWLEEMCGRVRGRLQLFPCHQLVDMVTSFAQVGFRPKVEWLSEWERCSGGALRDLGQDELTAVVWALAEMEHRPQGSWLYSYVLVVYSCLSNFEASQLASIFNSLTRISPQTEWVDQLVQICASETKPSIFKSKFRRVDDEEHDDRGGSSPGSPDSVGAERVLALSGNHGLWRSEGRGSLVLQMQSEVETALAGEDSGVLHAAAGVQPAPTATGPASAGLYIQAPELSPQVLSGEQNTTAGFRPSSLYPESQDRLNPGLVLPKPYPCTAENSLSVNSSSTPSACLFTLGSSPKDTVDVALPLQPGLMFQGNAHWGSFGCSGAPETQRREVFQYMNTSWSRSMSDEQNGPVPAT